MTLSIDKLITAKDIVTYWEEAGSNLEPYLGETLFADDKTIGLEIEWAKGANNVAVALKPAAFDTKATIRDRRSLETVKAELAFFRESMVLKEKDRQQLMQFMKTNDQALIDAALKNLYDDKASLIEGARTQRERMIMQLLATGTIGIEANGQKYEYDYKMPASHKLKASKVWSDPTANIFADIQAAKKVILKDTGVTCTVGICNEDVWTNICSNTAIIREIQGVNNLIVGEEEVSAWFKKKLKLNVVVYNKYFQDETGAEKRFFEESVFTLIPGANLGKFVYGTTPEEADLMHNSSASVALTSNKGIAVATEVKSNPVSVETIASMVGLPSFPRINQIAIIDTTKTTLLSDATPVIDEDDDI